LTNPKHPNNCNGYLFERVYLVKTG